MGIIRRKVVKGVILAAGRGARLSSLTVHKPKPLLTIAGKTLFEWQMEAMKIGGVDDITVVTGYLGEQFSNFDIKRKENSRWASSNMVRTLMCVDDILSKESCVVSYGDIVYHPDIVKKLIGTKGDIVISYDKEWLDLWMLRGDNPLEDAESFAEQGGVLLDIGRKVTDLSEISGQYMGLILIRTKGWEKIKEKLQVETEDFINNLDMTALLQLLLSGGVEINTMRVNGNWLEVDTPVDLARYQEKISNDSSWSHDWRW